MEEVKAGLTTVSPPLCDWQPEECFLILILILIQSFLCDLTHFET